MDFGLYTPNRLKFIDFFSVAQWGKLISSFLTGQPNKAKLETVIGEL